MSVSPNRPNIYYEVHMRTEIETDFADLLSSLQLNLCLAPRVIVYYRSLNVCYDLYAHFLYELGTASYYPPGAPQTSDNRLFGMFHSSTPEYNKDVILKSLVNPIGIVRAVFATIALGMGVNLQNVNKYRLDDKIEVTTGFRSPRKPEV